MGFARDALDGVVVAVERSAQLFGGELAGGVLQEDLSEVAYRAFPSALVEKTTLDAAGLKVGDIVHVKDLDIAKNKDIDLKTDPEAVVLSVIPVHNVVPETEVTTAPAAAAAEEKETK